MKICNLILGALCLVGLSGINQAAPTQTPKERSNALIAKILSNPDYGLQTKPKANKPAQTNHSTNTLTKPTKETNKKNEKNKVNWFSQHTNPWAKPKTLRTSNRAARHQATSTQQGTTVYQPGYGRNRQGYQRRNRSLYRMPNIYRHNNMDRYQWR